MDTSSQPAKRERRSIAQKREIVEATFAPGASVARVARAHGVNANQVFGWRRLYLAGRLGQPVVRPRALLPVAVSDAAAGAAVIQGEESKAAPSNNYGSVLSSAFSSTIQIKLRKRDRTLEAAHRQAAAASVRAKSEELQRQIEQLELRLEDLEANQPTESLRSTVPALTPVPAAKPARRPLPEHLPRETHKHDPPRQTCPDCGGALRFNHLLLHPGFPRRAGNNSNLYLDDSSFRDLALLRSRLVLAGVCSSSITEDSGRTVHESSAIARLRACAEVCRLIYGASASRLLSGAAQRIRLRNTSVP